MRSALAGRIRRRWEVPRDRPFVTRAALGSDSDRLWGGCGSQSPDPAHGGQGMPLEQLRSQATGRTRPVARQAVLLEQTPHGRQATPAPASRPTDFRDRAYIAGATTDRLANLSIRHDPTVADVHTPRLGPPKSTTQHVSLGQTAVPGQPSDVTRNPCRGWNGTAPRASALTPCFVFPDRDGRV